MIEWKGNMKLYKEHAFLILVGIGMILLAAVYFLMRDTSTEPTVDLNVPRMIEQTTENSKETTINE